MTNTQVDQVGAKIAPGPRNRCALMSTLDFSRRQLEFLRELADGYGDVANIKLLGKQWFLVSHPELIEEVFVKHARIMLRDDYSQILQRALGMGLLTSDGDLWKRQRKLMSQAFTPKRIKGYAEAMVQVTDAALASIAHGNEINLHEEMSRVTMEVVTAVLFGTSVSASNVETVRSAMAHINEFFSHSPEALLRLPESVPTPRNWRMSRAVKQIDSLIYEMIGKRRGAPAGDDLLGTLIAAQDDDGTRMEDKQLRDEAVTLFLAGHETTALALAHTFYLLSKHPAVERRLHDEIAQVLGGRLPTFEDVKSLPYTDQVLKESMRLYPPAWTTGRTAAEEVIVGGYRIPKGAQILISQWVVHRDPRWFPNPEGFDPDRWEPARAAKLPRYAYFPFGGGPRVCIGNHFAMLEAALILAVIVQRYRFELLPGQRLHLKPSVTLRQEGPGLRAVVRARSRSGVAPSVPPPARDALGAPESLAG
jgi:cytochrome P450